MSPAPGRPAVFLDRDGTLNRELEGALARVEDLDLLEGALEGSAALHAAGFALVVISNQSAIARGWADPAQVADVNRELVRRMTEAGAEPVGVYICPHHPSAGAPPYRRACGCRKPAPGLLRLAAREHALDVERSWVVGDGARDLAAGAALGIEGVLVRTGKGELELERLRARGREPARIAADLREAARQILADPRGADQGR